MMTKEKKEEEEKEKTIKRVVIDIECEVDEVNGDEEHEWVMPLHRRYLVCKESEVEKMVGALRVRRSMWRLLKGMVHEIFMETDESSSIDELLFANRYNITTKAVVEMRQQDADRRRGVPAVAGGEKKRKSLLEAAIEDKEERDKTKSKKEKEEKEDE